MRYSGVEERRRAEESPQAVDEWRDGDDDELDDIMARQSLRLA